MRRPKRYVPGEMADSAAEPSGKLISRLDIDTQEHLGVLGSAVLRTLPEVKASLMRVDHMLWVIGDQSVLPARRGTQNCDRYPPTAAG